MEAFNISGEDPLEQEEEQWPWLGTANPQPVVVPALPGPDPAAPHGAWEQPAASQAPWHSGGRGILPQIHGDHVGPPVHAGALYKNIFWNF